MKTKTKKISIAIATAVTVTGLLTGSGCTRTIDPVQANAELVPGTSYLYRFCDLSTLIYVSVVTGDSDNPEALFVGMCERGPDGVWKPAIDAPIPSQQVAPKSQEQEMNQQDNRDEGE